MPCRSPEQNDRDRLAERCAKLIISFDAIIGVDTPQDIKLVVGIYSFHGDKLNKLTAHLCAKLRALTECERERIIYNAKSKESRALADWWEEHCEHDRVAGRFA